ncbi:hypothetical protein PC129_g20027 [Phytophthora cactorum]|uniref:Uncharacterized protein n=1 Tax=Phytophthora cactorum TaxID=29920 RepID=A0A8T1BHM4_9STRA|nr:hypothetical protein PC117_g21629 [Phytophthora cactorum]KAG3153670.1 hypothetical protein PC128_g22529 [Phytophthora cactorum]KAG3208954.1 hypothetical protein PC129_g20027 [Phytophthora cactorum]
MQYSVSAGRLAGVKAACTDLFMSTHLAVGDDSADVNAISAFTVDKGNVGNILSSFSARLQTLWYKYMY